LTNTTVYNRLQDELSKKIFINRLLFSFTGESVYHNNILDEMGVSKRSSDECKDILCQSNAVVIYGAGVIGQLVKQFMDTIYVDTVAFCDSDSTKHNKTFHGVLCLSIDELKRSFSHCIVIISIASAEVIQLIRDNLLSLGFQPHQVKSYRDLYLMQDANFEDKQYFDRDVLDNYVASPDKHVFIDAGCYDFSNSLDFIKWTGREDSKVIAFEPDPRQYSVCLEKSKSLHNAFVHPYGLWNKNTELFFSSNDNVRAASRITDAPDTNLSIKVKALDSVLTGEYVSFIKMDVEGAELNALKGAAKTIKKHKPILAVCVYHKAEDILEIPEFTLSLNNNYKFYLRHYSVSICETVLYALPG